MSATRYFDNCKSVQEVKDAFKKLAKQFHPDLTQDANEKAARTNIFQYISEQFHAALKSFDKTEQRGSDGQEHYYYYNAKRETAQAAKVVDTLRIKGNFEVLVIGAWVWVRGETKPIKEELKALGYSWHSKRVAWYWRPAEHVGRFSYNDRISLDGLQEVYGGESFRAQENMNYPA